MYSVITDTSANLPTPLLKEREIGVLPFSYTIEDKTYTCLDTEAYDGKAFFQAIRNGVVVTTSQINPQTYIDGFEEALREGRDVLYIGMSSGISGSCSSAHMAAQELAEEYPDRRVEVVDTRGASLGEGILALLAADMRDAGLSLDEALERLGRLTECMCNVFTVDDLMHLRRTGRLSNLTAIVGTVLNIKPLLKGDENGKIVSFGPCGLPGGSRASGSNAAGKEAAEGHSARRLRACDRIPCGTGYTGAVFPGGRRSPQHPLAGAGAAQGGSKAAPGGHHPPAGGEAAGAASVSQSWKPDGLREESGIRKSAHWIPPKGGKE